jgi:hypothetical protein
MGEDGELVPNPAALSKQATVTKFLFCSVLMLVAPLVVFGLVQSIGLDRIRYISTGVAAPWVGVRIFVLTALIAGLLLLEEHTVEATSPADARSMSSLSAFTFFLLV